MWKNPLQRFFYKLIERINRFSLILPHSFFVVDGFVFVSRWYSVYWSQRTNHNWMGNNMIAWMPCVCLIFSFHTMDNRVVLTNRLFIFSVITMKCRSIVHWSIANDKRMKCLRYVFVKCRSSSWWNEIGAPLLSHVENSCWEHWMNCWLDIGQSNK